MTDPTLAVLEVLGERTRASRSELVAATGLSAATVSRAVGRLRRDGVIREGPLVSTGVGRPPRVVELDDRMVGVVGIDAGGRTLRAAMGDLAGSIRIRAARPVRDPDDRDALVGDLLALVRDVSEASPPGAVRALVAGVSGIVDHSSGRVLLSPDLPGLTGVALAAALEDRLGIPVAIDNDDLLAAIGEASAGAAVGCRDVVFLALGYGLGAGVIVDGRPVRGATNAAGAIGFIAPGRLDRRASGRAIPVRYREALARTDVTGEAPVTDAREVFERAAAGDPIATRVVADVLTDLGDLVVDVGALLDPEVIVVGGGLTDAGAAVFAPLDARLRAALPYPPRIVPSALHDAAVLHGAVSLAVALARRRLAGLDPFIRTDPDRPALSLA
jgi:predicted NBD/HSP70 family sugar kinase